MKKAFEYHHIHRAAIAILTYLRSHPDAKDNLEGVASWWVNEEQSLVEESLSLLARLSVVKREHDLYSLEDHLGTEGLGTHLERVLQQLQENERL